MLRVDKKKNRDSTSKKWHISRKVDHYFRAYRKNHSKHEKRQAMSTAKRAQVS